MHFIRFCYITFYTGKGNSHPKSLAAAKLYPHRAQSSTDLFDFLRERGARREGGAKRPPRYLPPPVLSILSIDIFNKREGVGGGYQKALMRVRMINLMDNSVDVTLSFPNPQHS